MPLAQSLLPAVCACVATLPLLAAAQGGSPGALLVAAADADRSGSVSEREWQAFSASVCKAGALDLRAVKREVLRAVLDATKDGKVAADDLEAIRKTLDRDGDGALRGRELSGARFGRGAVASVLARFADANEDGSVTGDEWAAHTRSLTANGVLDAKRMIAKLIDDEPAADKRLAAARPGAFTWRVFLMTFESGLDIDGDGGRTPKDLERLFSLLDRNGDKTIDAAEARARVGRGDRGAPRRRTRNAGAGPRPPLMPWQRNLDDALALVAKTGKPLLICVNMEGESASDTLARDLYRDPEFVALARGFIPVIAAPTRRNVRDYGDRGRRIPDPRFGRVTSAEHMAIEPVLFERYFEGRRVAPRHIGIAEDGTRLFDIFLTRGFSAIEAALKKHGKPDAAPARELTEAELLASPDAAHRERLEARFLAGDERTRARLAAASVSASRKTQHFELLRMALFDPSPAVGNAAAAVVAAHAQAVPDDFHTRAFGRADAARASQLADALHGLAATAGDAERKKTLRQRARVFAALALRSTLVPPPGSGGADRVVPPPSAGELDGLDERLGDLEDRLKAKKGDRELTTQLAETTLRYARVRLLSRNDPSLLLQDARSAALLATSPDAPNVRALAVAAHASWLHGDAAAAARHATAALPLLRGRLGTSYAADTLWVFVQARTRALYDAIKANAEYPASWVTDAAPAYARLTEHAAATEAQVQAFVQWLGVLEVWQMQEDVVAKALRRWPASGKLHERMRSVALWNGGGGRLRSFYAKTRVSGPAGPTFDWYAGLGLLVAAERCAANKDRAGALASYGASLERFAASTAAQPSFAASANHYRCLAHAGSARVEAERGEWVAAVRLIQEALAGPRAALGSKDGLGRTPLENGDWIARRLRAAGRGADAEIVGVLLEEARGG